MRVEGSGLRVEGRGLGFREGFRDEKLDTFDPGAVPAGGGMGLNLVARCGPSCGKGSGSRVQVLGVGGSEEGSYLRLKDSCINQP